MLFPLAGIPVLEYDVTFTVTPTSRQGHSSDSVLVNTEALVRNDSGEDLTFPFLVLNTDPGVGAESREAVEPKVLNGSRPVDLDEVDQAQAAELARQRVAAIGADAELQEEVRRWAEVALSRAERTKRGRTRIRHGESRRIVLQQRLRVLPEDGGTYCCEMIAPSPLLTIPVRGRVSVVGLLPFEDDDIRVTVVPELTEQGYSYELGRVKQRQIVSWFWTNDPIFRLGYRYA